MRQRWRRLVFGVWLHLSDRIFKRIKHGKSGPWFFVSFVSGLMRHRGGPWRVSTFCFQLPNDLWAAPYLYADYRQFWQTGGKLIFLFFWGSLNFVSRKRWRNDETPCWFTSDKDRDRKMESPIFFYILFFFFSLPFTRGFVSMGTGTYDEELSAKIPPSFETEAWNKIKNKKLRSQREKENKYIPNIISLRRRK